MARSIEDFGSKAAATAAFVAVAAAALHAEPTWGSGLARTLWLGLGLAAAATLFAVFRAGAFARRCVAVTILLAAAGLLVLRLGGFDWTVPNWPGTPYVAVLLSAVSIAILGVVLRHRSGRWLALALAFVGTATALINVGLTSIEPECSTWLLYALSGALVLVNLAGRPVALDDTVDDRDFSQAWSTHVRPAWWLRAAVLSALVAAPMLLLYGFAEWGAVPAYEAPAILIAIALLASVFAVVRGRAIGALMLGASGLATVVLSFLVISTADFAFERDLAAYYVAFWLPAGLAASVSGTTLTRAALRLLDDKP